MNVPGLGTRPYWRVPVPLMFKIIHILSTKTAYFEHILDKYKNHGTGGLFKSTLRVVKHQVMVPAHIHTQCSIIRASIGRP